MLALFKSADTFKLPAWSTLQSVYRDGDIPAAGRLFQGGALNGRRVISDAVLAAADDRDSRHLVTAELTTVVDLYFPIIDMGGGGGNVTNEDVARVLGPYWDVKLAQIPALGLYARIGGWVEMHANGHEVCLMDHTRSAFAPEPCESLLHYLYRHVDEVSSAVGMDGLRHAFDNFHPTAIDEALSRFCGQPVKAALTLRSFGEPCVGAYASFRPAPRVRRYGSQSHPDGPYAEYF